MTKTQSYFIISSFLFFICFSMLSLAFIRENPDIVRAAILNKSVKVETGAMVTVPLSVNEGDTIRINTETGEYRERV